MNRSTCTPFLLFFFLLFYSFPSFAQPSCLGDTIMYEDFANGLNNPGAGNPFGAFDTSGADHQYWEHDFDGPDSLNVDSLNSLSAGNGFMIFDLYKKTPGGFADEPIAGYLETPVMDLSFYPYPRIEFYTQFYHCCNSDWNLEMEVSTDGGANYSTSFNLSKNWDRDVLTPDSLYLGINLGGAISANPTNVKIRFSWDASLPDSNGEYSSEYFWMVDDILIKQGNLNDIEAGNAGYEPANSVLIGNGLDRPLAYNEIPRSQIHTMKIGSEVCNIGRNPLTGIQTQVNVFRNGNAMDTVYSAYQVINSQACYGDTLFATYTPYLWAWGDYQAALSVFSDSTDCTPMNNYPIPDTLRFYVTDSTYALDNYRRGGVTDQISAPSDLSGGYKSFRAANTFEMFGDRFGDLFISSISFYAHPDSTEDGAGPFTVKLYEWDDATTELATSDSQTIDFSDPQRDTGMIRVGLNNVYPVDIGDTIWASVNYHGGSKNFGIGQSGLTPSNSQSSLVYGDYGGGGATWHRVEKVPIVRVNFDWPVNIAENEKTNSFHLGQNQPNPFTNQTIIPYRLSALSQVKFEVFDVAGKQVMNIDRGNEAQGEHQILIDGGALGAGIYYYALTVDGERRTRKMVIMEY